MLSSQCRSSSTKEGQRKHEVRSKQKVRYEEFTRLGKSLLDGTADLSTPHVQIKLMTYNILAQTHMMTHIRGYRNCPSECLNWNFRKGILSHELEVEKPDIFCLQEVENKHRIEILEPLRKLGYDALYVARGEDRPDGCALLYNTSKFQIADFSPVYYFRSEVPLLDRPNVGMVAKLELCDHPGNYITVANTHILYNQRRLDIKMSQLQILLAETERLAFADSPDKYYPVILTGDLNVNSKTSLIKLLRYRYADCQQPVRTFRGKDHTPPDQLLRHHLNINSDCQYIDVLEGRKKGIKDVRKTQDPQDIVQAYRAFPESTFDCGSTKDNSMKTREEGVEKLAKDQQVDQKSKEPSDFGRRILRHGFPFIDVYEHPDLDGALQNRASSPVKRNVFDYIFYSGDLQYKHRTAPFKPVKSSLQLLSRLRMPTASEYRLYFPSLPNYACGSDHLPLCATFLLPVH